MDCFFNPYPEYNFFDAYPIDDKTFIGGTDTTLSGRLYGEPIFKYLMGVMYVTKENFDKVGGYREVSKDYFGNEDYDLNEKIENDWSKANWNRSELYYIPYPTYR